MKLFAKTSIVLIALMPLMQSCNRLSPAVDGASSDKTKLAKEWRTYKGWDSMCLANGGRDITAGYGPWPQWQLAQLWRRQTLAGAAGMG
jgi:hypothetical protein